MHFEVSYFIPSGNQSVHIERHWKLSEMELNTMLFVQIEVKYFTIDWRWRKANNIDELLQYLGSKLFWNKVIAFHGVSERQQSWEWRQQRFQFSWSFLAIAQLHNPEPSFDEQLLQFQRPPYESRAISFPIQSNSFS